MSSIYPVLLSLLYCSTYSGTSDKGPSYKARPLYKGHLFRPHANTLVYYFISEIVDRDNLPTRDKTINPKVSLVQRFHYIVYHNYYTQIFSRIKAPGFLPSAQTDSSTVHIRGLDVVIVHHYLCFQSIFEENVSFHSLGKTKGKLHD